VNKHLPAAAPGAVFLSLVIHAGCAGDTTSSNVDGGSSQSDASNVDEGSGEASVTDAGNPDAGGDSYEASADCSAMDDPPGTTFTFHVHNGGSTDQYLAYDCGGGAPMVLTTPAGSLGISPSSVYPCASTCDQAYAGNVASCPTCTTGNTPMVAAGTTFDITWDRRVYASQPLDPRCYGGALGGTVFLCGLGTAVAPSASQSGKLTVCPLGGWSSSGAPPCQTITFTVDLTQSEGTIEVP
jgi:hypothetical protein